MTKRYNLIDDYSDESMGYIETTMSEEELQDAIDCFKNNNEDFDYFDIYEMLEKDYDCTIIFKQDLDGAIYI